MATTVFAIVTKGDKVVKESIPVPVPGNHELLVKVSHAAQNPTDVKALGRNAYGDGAVLGCDLVGVVEKLGPEATKFNVGDTVVGLLWGGERKGLGAFSEYTLVNEELCFPLPDGITPEQAATLPLASATAVLALFSKHCLNIPKNSNNYILIWGGASSVGQYAIQIAKYHGLKVITTCSPRNYEHAKVLGASHTFDYRDESVAAKIKEATGSELKYVFDTIGSETSSMVASQAISEEGGILCTVRPGKVFAENVVTNQTRVTDVLLWTIMNKVLDYTNFNFPVREGDREIVIGFFEDLPTLVTAGAIKPNTAKVFNGLDDVPKGFQEFLDGVVSNYKIVYSLASQ